MSKGILVFGEDWNRHPSSTQHLIRELSASHPVLWVNSIGLRQPKLRWRDFTRCVNKLWTLVSRRFAKRKTSVSMRQAQTVPANMTICSVWCIPAPRSRWMRRFNRWLIQRQIGTLLASAQLDNPRLWVSLPTAVDLVGAFNESQVIYYCGDDFGGLAGVDHETVLAREDELLACSERVFVASERLLQKFKARPECVAKVRLLTHGVDVALFAQPTQVHPNLIGLRQSASAGNKIIGFYGSVAEWLDQRLIEQVSNALPNYQFVFVGNIETDILALTRCPNIHFYPAVAHHELPQYVQHWDISWLPFKDCAQIRFCNPLKLKEYLAAGRPVVSTVFPAAEPYKDVLAIVEDAREAVATIESLMQEAACKKDLRRVRQTGLVKQDSWQEKARLVEAAWL